MQYQLMTALVAALATFTQRAVATPLAVVSEPADSPKLVSRGFNLFTGCDQTCYSNYEIVCRTGCICNYYPCWITQCQSQCKERASEYNSMILTRATNPLSESLLSIPETDLQSIHIRPRSRRLSPRNTLNFLVSS